MLNPIALPITSIKTKAVAALCGGGISLGIVDWAGVHDPIVVAIAVIVSSISTVLCMGVPRIVSAVSIAKAGARTAQEAETGKLFERINAAHREEVQSLNERNKELSDQNRRDAQEYRERLKQSTSRLDLMRATKHKCLGAYQAAIFHIHNLEDITREKGLTPPQFMPVSFAEIFGEEDAQVTASAKATLSCPEHVIPRT